MNEFKVIVVMNEALIKLLKDNGKNYEDNLRIQEKLKDEALFFKIQKPEAIELLKIVGVKEEQLENVYNKLTAPKIFYDLEYKGIINKNDENLIVKYENYNDLFKKSNKKAEE